MENQFFIYLVENQETVEFDEHRAIVCIAESEKRAKEISPFFNCSIKLLGTSFIEKEEIVLFDTKEGV